MSKTKNIRIKAYKTLIFWIALALWKFVEFLLDFLLSNCCEKFKCGISLVQMCLIYYWLYHSLFPSLQFHQFFQFEGSQDPLLVWGHFVPEGRVWSIDTWQLHIRWECAWSWSGSFLGPRNLIWDFLGCLEGLLLRQCRCWRFWAARGERKTWWGWRAVGFCSGIWECRVLRISNWDRGLRKGLGWLDRGWCLGWPWQKGSSLSRRWRKSRTDFGSGQVWCDRESAPPLKCCSCRSAATRWCSIITVNEQKKKNLFEKTLEKLLNLDRFDHKHTCYLTII